VHDTERPTATAAGQPGGGEWWPLEFVFAALPGDPDGARTEGERFEAGLNVT